MGIWDSIKETGESLGGMAIAPAGAVYDIASMPFDDKDDSFGTVVGKLSKRGGDFIDPVMNPNTMPGYSIRKAFEGANWAYEKGVDTPVATVNYMSAHIAATRDAGDLFDPQAWGQAYDLANTNSLDIGKSAAVGNATAGAVLGNEIRGLMGKEKLDESFDPFDHGDPFSFYQTLTSGTPGVNSLLTISAGTTNVAAMFAGDPVYLGLKAASKVRALTYLGKLNIEQRAQALKLMGDPMSKVARRTDRFLDVINGNNALKRPLNAQETKMFLGTTGRQPAEVNVIAGLLSEAGKASDPLVARDAQRRILAVAMGDTAAVGRMRAELASMDDLADQLDNMLRGSTLDLERMALDPTFANSPEFMARIDGQLSHLRGEGALDKFIAHHETRLQQIIGLEGRIDRTPMIHAQGKRALMRENNMGLLRAPANAHRAVDEWTAKFWAGSEGSSTLLQKGLKSVPVLAIKTAGLAASPWTKFPVAAADALRTTKFVPIAHMDDWGGTTSRLDSMLKAAGADDASRTKMLSETFLASTPAEKRRVIDRVQAEAVKHVAARYSRPGQEINSAYVENLVQLHLEQNGRTMSHLQGRAYSATVGEDGLRVDQKLMTEHGTPAVLTSPLFESQGENIVPLMDIDLVNKIMSRDQSHFSRLSRAWQKDADELSLLERRRLAEKFKHQLGKPTGLLPKLDRAVRSKQMAMDMSIEAGQALMRAWKVSVLFRLGYPQRVLADDHMRIAANLRYGTFLANNVGEAARNMKYNQMPVWFQRARGRLDKIEAGRSRKVDAFREVQNLRNKRQVILDQLDGDLMKAWPDRAAELAKVSRSTGGHRGNITKLQKQLSDAEAKRDLGLAHDDIKTLQQKIALQEQQVADKEAHIAYLQEQMGDLTPDGLQQELEALEQQIRAGEKAHRGTKKHVGLEPVRLRDGNFAPAPFEGAGGHIAHELSKSDDTFRYYDHGVEQKMYTAMSGGAHRTIVPTEPGHLHAWADAVNNQIRNSEVAMFFVRGGSRDEFVHWIGQPEQAHLRKRVADYAHDPEDWGGRVEAMIHEYVPSQEMAEAIIKGRVSARDLNKMFGDPGVRPAVHGRVVADNLGISMASQAATKFIDSFYKWSSTVPTDHLTRHPFFNSLYRQHVQDLYDIKRTGYAAEGKKFTQADMDDLAAQARKLSLHDVRRTLFDMSAHSQAAHMMRFVSPFFAAHQETLARWWRIVGDRPQVLRRFQQVFDLPRQAGLTVDEDGNPVKPGDTISNTHRIMLQMPLGLGGNDPSDPRAPRAVWQINENSFNIALQGGLTNPGAGPLLSVPMDYLSQKYADETEVRRLAHIFNPYPSDSPVGAALPATVKRALAISYSRGGPDVAGIGQKEYNNEYQELIKDLTTEFILDNGREPTQEEQEDLLEQAGHKASAHMVLRFLWNSGSGAPANSGSKYSAIQNGWYKISEQARAQGKDHDWAIERFEDMYGEAYLPLIYSNSNNSANLTPSASVVGAIKRYRGVLERTDPAVARAILGAYEKDMSDESNEYAVEARNWLLKTRMRSGSTETYMDYDDPRAAAEEAQAKRGWRKYGQLTAALTAQAQEMGLTSYKESDELNAIKRAGLKTIMEENYAFKNDYNSFNPHEFEDRILPSLRIAVKAPSLARDPERQDIQVLNTYLQLRDFVSQILEQRKAAGLGGPDAKASEPIRRLFTQTVGYLVETNTEFEEYIYNGTVERDPLLIGD